MNVECFTILDFEWIICLVSTRVGTYVGYVISININIDILQDAHLVL
jgi:formate-dependent nitrite reductase membrane component NrfD